MKGTTELERLAEQLFLANSGWRSNPYYPLRRPKLSDLWPSEQEKYKRMAEAAMKSANA